ncbi:hypothetical protein D3C81_1611410 [compost metagenome]
MLLESRKGLGAHSALPNHCTNAELFNNVALIRLLANACSRPRSLHMPALIVLQHHRTAVVDHSSIQVNRRIMIHQIFMQSITPCVHFSLNDDYITDAQAANLLL